MGFYGRKHELEQLRNLKKKKSASLVVIRGRRRVGKSSLIHWFSKEFSNFYEFIGLPPRKGMKEHDQLDEFGKQFSRQFKLPEVHFQNWNEAFLGLTQQISKVKAPLVLFDEISWMSLHSPDFSGILKTAWDTQFKENRGLILVLCGSVSSWIENNILSHSGFVGRVSLTIDLGELELADTSRFWGNKKVSSFEKTTFLSVCGAIPKYLEEMDPTQTAEANIHRLCFTKGGYLFEDFERIFSDIFGRRSETYKKIVLHLVAKKLSAKELATKLKLTQGGDLTQYLRDMELSGFIARDYVYLPTGEKTHLSRYRIRDNYLRFYLKYILPNRDKIEKGLFQFQGIYALHAWKTIFGFQFENLILNHLVEIINALEIQNQGVLMSAAPYFQTKTVRREACQIDLLISLKNKNHFVCEMKLREKIDIRVVKEVSDKIRKFKIPKSHSIRPVLIYDGNLEDEVVESDFFDIILPFSRVFKS